jgi:hypothetical protein
MFSEDWPICMLFITAHASSLILKNSDLSADFSILCWESVTMQNKEPNILKTEDSPHFSQSIMLPVYSVLYTITQFLWIKLKVTILL